MNNMLWSNAFIVSGKVSSPPLEETFLVIALYYCITLLKSIYSAIISSCNYQASSCISLSLSSNIKIILTLQLFHVDARSFSGAEITLMLMLLRLSCGSTSGNSFSQSTTASPRGEPRFRFVNRYFLSSLFAFLATDCPLPAGVC